MEITISDAEMQQLQAQYDAITERAKRLLESCEGHLDEAVEALLDVYAAPDGVDAVIYTLVRHHGVDHVRALIAKVK